MIVLFSSHLVYLLLSNGYVIFQSTGFVTKDQLVTELGWDLHRADIALEHLVREGLAWVDEQGDTTQYWFPGLFHSIIDK